MMTGDECHPLLGCFDVMAEALMALIACNSITIYNNEWLVIYKTIPVVDGILHHNN